MDPHSRSTLRQPRPRWLPLCLLALLAAPLAAEETFYYVDPVAGVDVVGGGTQEAPWRSITFALTQPLDPLARLYLAPGVYSAATGEAFPLELRPGLSVGGELLDGARIEHPLGGPPSPVFRVHVTRGGPCCSGVDNLAIASGHLAVEVVVEPGVRSFYVTLRALDVEAPAFVDATIGADAEGVLALGGCVVEPPYGADVRAVVRPGTAALGSQLSLDVSRCRIYGREDGVALELRADGPHAQATLTGTSSILRGAGAGLYAVATDGGVVGSRIENFVFWGLGATPWPTGGIVDDASGGSPAPLHEITNSIFWNNVQLMDLPDYDPATYTLVTNLFQQPNLIGVGGSIGGPPVWVDPWTFDFHLSGTSPARDAGTTPPSGLLLDLDGDPRAVVHGGDGLIDIGADEYYERYVYLHPRPVLGATVRLRTLGPAGEPYAVYVGPISYWPDFGMGQQLLSLYQPAPLAFGVLPSDFAEDALGLPSLPALAGFPFMLQAVYAAPSGLAFSENAYKGWIGL